MEIMEEFKRRIKSQTLEENIKELIENREELNLLIRRKK